MAILDELIDQYGRYRLRCAGFDLNLLQNFHKLVFLGACLRFVEVLEMDVACGVGFEVGKNG
jgi:hypothetical protein